MPSPAIPKTAITPTSLTARIHELVSACFTGIWLETCEPEEACREISSLCQTQSWRLASWDCDVGLKIHGHDLSTQHNNPAPTLADTTDPLAVIRSAGQLSQGADTTLIVLHNFHRFLGATEILQALGRQVSQGKHTRTFLLILSPVVNIPIEIEKLFTVVEHELPSRDQLHEIATGIATESEMPSGDGGPEKAASGDGIASGDSMARVLDSAAGLTRYEAEGAFSLSIVRHGRLDSACIWEAKSQQLKKSGLVSLHRGHESFQQLGGLENLKSFCLRAMRHPSQNPSQNSSPPTQNRPRGVLLLSPPGCGKSQFAKALGNETGRPTVVLDIANLLGSLVGQSESNIRQALKLVDAMAPCVAYADELEKSLAGASSSGQTDSGVTARIFGSLLTWLNDHESDVFFVATCNDASKLPPEFARAERFDGVFFVDLPGEKQREDIWEIYTRHYGLDPHQARPNDTNWTGAEIKSCCRLASLLDVPLVGAAQNVVPVAVTAGDKIEQLRQWASGRCLSADRAGVYSREQGQDRASATGSRARRVIREPGVN